MFEAGEGKSLGELEALAADVNVDRVKTRLRAVGDEVEQLNQAIEGCSHDIGTHRLTLQRHFEEHEGASQSADDAEAELASIGRHARRFAVLRMAITLLSREIERYRQENQGPVLRRASELFPRLTLERYRELRVDFSDADAAELRCVRADGRDLSIAELSDGTRDQLYLALRLASLERYAVRSEPVPLVFDDILIHFDDERATAALQVIDELSSTFQVLFFTHHARLLELARSALGGRLREHVLSPRPLRAAGGASTVSVGGAVT